MQVERENLLGEALSSVREAIRNNETGSAYWASPSRLRTRTSNARNLVPAATGPLTAASDHKASLWRFRPISRARWLIESRGGLDVASGVGPDLALSEHGLCFVEGTVTLDDVSFTMKIAYISRLSLDSEGHWTPLDLGTGSIVYAPKRLRGYCEEQSSAYPASIRRRRALA